MTSTITLALRNTYKPHLAAPSLLLEQLQCFATFLEAEPESLRMRQLFV
jgi:hypothetical protein